MSRFIRNCLLSTCSKPVTALDGGDRAEQHTDPWPFGSAQSNGRQTWKQYRQWGTHIVRYYLI